MNKIDCIEDYFVSTRAFYLFLCGLYSKNFDLQQYILDKKYIVGAKVAFISNIMLGIKEDLVDNLGARVYESKIYQNRLETTVQTIATKVSNGYKMGNYVFEDAPTVIAIIRNKLAHGNYIIDFEHNRIIINHKNVDIVINIDKLILFLMKAFQNSIFDIKTNAYERNFVYYNHFNNSRENNLKDLEEVSKIIKKYNYVSFKLESLDGSVIGYDCLYCFEQLILHYKNNISEPLEGSYFNKVKEYCNMRNCNITVEFGKIKGYDKIKHILDYASKEILANPNLNYMQQLKLLGMEIERTINDGYNVFNPLNANLKNIMLLSAINKTNSVDHNTLSNYVDEVYGKDISFSYDEFGMSVIGMVNSLFIYPFDNVYTSVGEYKLDRSLEFDFSKLDLSMVNPIVLTIDESPLINAEDRCNALIKRRDKLQEKINEQMINLTKVKGNEVAENKINASILDLQKSLSSLLNEYVIVDADYNAIKADYTDNSLYFKNRAIIEGIRNSIAHGNYEIVSNSNFNDIVIVFKNIYEGKLLFHLEIKFIDIEKLIDNNYAILLSYINNKINNRRNDSKKN